MKAKHAIEHCLKLYAGGAVVSSIRPDFLTSGKSSVVFVLADGTTSTLDLSNLDRMQRSVQWAQIQSLKVQFGSMTLG